MNFKTGLSEKRDHSYIKDELLGQKRELTVYLAVLKKGPIRHVHRYCHI